MERNVKTTSGTLSDALTQQGFKRSQNDNKNTIPEKEAVTVVSNSKNGQHPPKRGKGSKDGEGKYRRNKNKKNELHPQHAHKNHSEKKRGRGEIKSCPLCGEPCFSYKDGKYPLLGYKCNDRYKKEERAAPQKMAQAIMDGKKVKEFPRKLEWTLNQIDIKRFEKEAAAAEVHFDLLRVESQKLLLDKKEAIGGYVEQSVFNELRKMCFNKVGANKAFSYMKSVQGRLKEAKKLLSEAKARQDARKAKVSKKPEMETDGNRLDGKSVRVEVNQNKLEITGSSNGKSDNPAKEAENVSKPEISAKKSERGKKPKEVKTTKTKAIKKPTAKKAASSKSKSETKSSKAKKDTSKK